MTALPTTTGPSVLTDSWTMLRRSLKHIIRYPSLSVLVIGMPVVFLLLFVYVFGGTIGVGLGGAGGPGAGREAYLAYLVPGVLVMTIASVSQGTAIAVAMDMTEGIIARFRTMDIARVSVLTGHVLGAVIRSLFSTLVVFGVAVLLGFRPTTGPLEWLGAFGIVALISFALTWLTVALGMMAKSVETASNTPMPLVFLPFLSSGFVPTESLPAGLSWFAEYQPFTPMIETLRALLVGTPLSAGTFWAAVAWSLGLSLLGYLLARARYERLPARV